MRGSRKGQVLLYTCNFVRDSDPYFTCVIIVKALYLPVKPVNIILHFLVPYMYLKQVYYRISFQPEHSLVLQEVNVTKPNHVPVRV